MQKVFVFLFATVVWLPEQAWAGSGAFKVKPAQVYTAYLENGSPVSCTQRKRAFVPGTMQPKNRFLPMSAAIKPIEKRLKKARRKKDAGLIAALTAEIAAMRAAVAGATAACSRGPGAGPPQPPDPPQPPSGPGPNPPGGTDEVSLLPLSRAMTDEDVRYLFEKAGFGFTPAETPYLAIAQSGGVSAVVDEFMKVRAEPAGLEARMADLLDGQLGTNTTQTPAGQRMALMDLWVNTHNPFSEKLAMFLLSVWTVAGDVIEAESFRGAFWDYYQLLRYHSRHVVSLPDFAVDASRHPMMLLYLNNDLNRKGSPNENFARELFELFTLGPVNLDGVPNYTETRTDGSGDIAVAARILTGWTTVKDWNAQVLRAAYRSEYHEDGGGLMFAEKPYAFYAWTDEQLIRGLFNNHPEVKTYYAREILKEYVTPNPPRALVENFANVLAQTNYGLRDAMRVLLKSTAFYHHGYRNTVPKNSCEFAVEAVRMFGLQNAINLGEVNRQLIDIGMPINLSPSVFWFSPDTWTSPAMALNRQNFLGYILGDSTAQRQVEPDWTPATVLPPGVVSSAELIEFVRQRLGVRQLESGFLLQLFNYLNHRKQYDGSYSAVAYNNLDAAHQKQKGMGLYAILMSTPDFQLK